MKRFFLRSVFALEILYLTSGCNEEATFSSGAKKSYDAIGSQVFSFKSSEINPASVTIKDGGRFTSVDIKQAEKSPNQVIQRQVKRQRYDATYTQGHNAKFSREDFQLSEAGYLDLLVVVDDSRSMSDEQLMVGKGLAPLISEVKDTNWQIAVISMSDPCVGTANLIKKTDANPDQKFAAAVQKPVDKMATEQGFPMAIQSLKGQCNGSVRRWLRDGSSVGILFLSDEENCGSDPGDQARCKNITGKSAAEMINFLRSIRSPEEARVYALVDKDGTCPDAAGKGTMYVEASTGTGGTAGSICHDFNPTAGYANYLSQVSTDVQRIVKRQFFLSAAPDMARFDVEVDGVSVPASGVITVKGNIVTIDPAAFKNGTRISFSYTHDAVPMFTEVPISAEPNPETLLVTVNGVNLSAGKDFTVNNSKRVIAFSQMPPEDAKVSVSYLENIPLLTRFSVNLTGLRPDTLKVSLNLVAVDPANFSYDAAGIDFPTPPNDGAIVMVSWKTDEQKILSYPAAISDVRHPVAWATKDKTTVADVPAGWDGKTLTFNPDQVIEGRIVTLDIDFGAKSALRTIDLPSERIDDKVKIFADGTPDICQALVSPSKLALDAGGADKAPDLEKDTAWKSRYKGRQLSLQCKDGAEYNELRVEYYNEVSRTGHFLVKIPEGKDPNDPSLGWKVFIDGRLTTQFKRVGSEIEIEEDLLPPETRIDVEVITYARYNK